MHITINDNALFAIDTLKKILEHKIGEVLASIVDLKVTLNFLRCIQVIVGLNCSEKLRINNLKTRPMTLQLGLYLLTYRKRASSIFGFVQWHLPISGRSVLRTLIMIIYLASWSKLQEQKCCKNFLSNFKKVTNLEHWYLYLILIKIYLKVITIFVTYHQVLIEFQYCDSLKAIKQFRFLNQAKHCFTQYGRTM